MAIQTRLQPKYTIQKLFVVGLCLGLGVWGIYDYAVKIPAKTRAYERGQICLSVKEAMEAEPATDAARQAITETSQMVEDELSSLLSAGVEEDDGAAPTAEEALASIKARGDDVWFKRLVLYGVGLKEAARRPPGAAASDQFAQVYEVVKRDVTETADVTKPGTFDRATQWMFILCIPFAPYFLWQLLRDRKRVFRLDDDGTFHAPGVTWSADEIADIDMSKWMSKSIAHVVHTDGRRIKLDDYIFKDTHLIAGALASRRYPDQWDETAKKRTPEEPEEETADAA